MVQLVADDGRTQWEQDTQVTSLEQIGASSQLLLNDAARPTLPMSLWDVNVNTQNKVELMNGSGPRKTRHSGVPLPPVASKRLKASDPDITAPTSMSPPQPQYLHSRQNSSIAESFITARESPWLSEGGQSPDEDYLSRFDDRSHGSHGFDPVLGFEFKPEATRNASHVKNDGSDFECDSEMMRNITIRPKRKTKPYNLASIPHNSLMPSPKQPSSPRTPTHREFPRKPPSPRTGNDGSPASSENIHRRYSSISSSSTIIEAMIISAPPQKAKQLRHVSKTPSLRSDASRSPLKHAMRVSSDSGSAISMQSTTKLSSSEARSESAASKANRTMRVATAPLLGRQRNGDLASEETLSQVARGRGSYAVQMPPNYPVMARDILAYPSAYVPLSSLPSHARNSSHGHVDRTSTADRPSATATHETIYRAKEPFTSPTSVPIASSTPDSLVTVISPDANSRQHSHSTNDGHRSLSLKRMNSKPSSPPVSFLALPSTARRPSDASGRSVDQSELGTRISLDRSTIRSEDHPRQMYSQSTPFSQMSDTPLEVGEATAISINPHNNHSLLLVDQLGKPAVVQPSKGQYLNDKEDPPDIAVQPSTPPSKFAEVPVDSPLRNPRAAPEPPKIMVLPATPMHDIDDPLASVAPHGSSTFLERPTMLQRARRYSDNVIQPFLRNNSFRRQRHSSQPARARQRYDKDRHLHPFWHPRDFWMNVDDSESDWDDVDDPDVEPLPPGGDTSEPPPSRMPRSLSRRLTGFKGNGGFLIGNSLNLERHGTNKKRHHIEPPPHFQNSQVSLRRDSSEHAHTSEIQLETPAQLRLRKSLGSLRSLELQHRLRRRRWRVLGVSVEYVGIGGLKQQWLQTKQRRENQKIEKRREEIRKSIGPRFVIENGLGSTNTQ